MRIPTATYRLQFHKDFGFAAARELIGYLRDLGISDLYASPIFKARAGSLHGYDVVDHSQIVQLECLRAGIWGTKSLWGRVVTYKG